MTPFFIYKATLVRFMDAMHDGAGEFLADLGPALLVSFVTMALSDHTVTDMFVRAIGGRDTLRVALTQSEYDELKREVMSVTAAEDAAYMADDEVQS